MNTATELEDRLEIRADMIYSGEHLQKLCISSFPLTCTFLIGIIPTVEKLKQLCFEELGKDFEVISRQDNAGNWPCLFS